MTGRITAHRRLCCTVKDAGFKIRRNSAIAGSPWWVHYNHEGNPVPADQPHPELVETVNDLKVQLGGAEGGAFSINEFGQVIARMADPSGQGSIQVIGVTAGAVYTCRDVISFLGGAVSPLATPDAGAPWPGPRCGISYSFAAPGATHHPTRRQDEVWMETDGQKIHLSEDASIATYPPGDGILGNFLGTLRKLLPVGGRFRVNEHGRAFTSEKLEFIGTAPIPHWFAPLNDRS